MTADPEAVTRALAEHWRTTEEIDEERSNEHSLVWRFRCQCGEALKGSRNTGHRAHLASVLASLPDDRLAEAEARVQRVEALHTADAPADPDLRLQLIEALQDEISDARAAEVVDDALLPLVRAQVEAARRDAWDEGHRHARDRHDDGIGLLSDNPYRDLAARGETRQP